MSPPHHGSSAAEGERCWNSSVTPYSRVVSGVRPTSRQQQPVAAVHDPGQCPGPRRGWSLQEGRCLFDQGEDGLALLDDVGGELGGVAAADVADRVDRSGRVNRTSPAVTVVGGWPSI